jgi:hypothetical protein
MKRSELTEFIKSEIINELSSVEQSLDSIVGEEETTDDVKAKNAAYSELNKTLEKTKELTKEDEDKEPTSGDVKAEKGAEAQKREALQKQERSKLVKDFLERMMADGIVDSNKKILDKEAYTKEWSKSKKEIEAQVKKVK